MAKYDDDDYYTAEDINDELDNSGDIIYENDDKMWESRRIVGNSSTFIFNINENESGLEKFYQKERSIINENLV